MDEKPSRNEDEYFARAEADLMRQRREALEAESLRNSRQMHFMKCPKCGADLKEVEMQGVKVDVCSECRGVWFDAGEVDQIKPEDRHPVRQVIGDFLSGLRK